MTPLPEISGHDICEPYNKEWFKQESLRLLGQRLAEMVYPGYPPMRDRLWYDGNFAAFDPLILPMGPWETSAGLTPTIPERLDFDRRNLRIDAYGRPLHPWLDVMIKDPAIGAVTGKGFYWNWGPNDTADPIILRRDLSEPHVLLIERGDGSGWALPGGFKNIGETDLEAAMREGYEETRIDVSVLAHHIKPIYKGPLADLRVTANAWPETAAIRFELELSNKKDLKKLTEMMATSRRQRAIRSMGRLAFTEQVNRLPWKGRDDAKKAAWVPRSKLSSTLFGSHSLLIHMALIG